MFRYTHPSGRLGCLAWRGAQENIWGGRCGREGPAEEGAGRRWLPSRLQAWEKPSSLSLVTLVLCLSGCVSNEANAMSVLARRDWLKVKNLLKTPVRSVDLGSC